MLGKEMLDPGRDKPKRCYLEIQQLLEGSGITVVFYAELDGVVGIHNAYKEELKWIVDGGWGDSFAKTIQESKKAANAVPQLSSHPKPGRPGGIHNAYKEELKWIVDGGWGDSFAKTIQELKKAANAVPQLSSHPKPGRPGGIHNAYKEELKWIVDGGWGDSFAKTIQELKKAANAVPQLSSHPKPGRPGGLLSYVDKLLQRIIPGYQQTKKVKEWSWRSAQLNILPEVRSQGHFETCVFFAVTGAVEGRYRLHMIRNDPDHVTVPQLSVQDAIDGIKEVPIDPATCLNWIIKQGVVPESDCPYTGVPQGGHALKEGRLSVVNSYHFINLRGECAEGIVREIMEGGPIVGIISYKSEYLHAVMLIGGVYKDDHVDEYVIQNSWGTGWEEDGRGLVPISYLVGAYVPVLG